MKLIRSIRTRIDEARDRHREGKLAGGILLWLLGVPIPIILLIFLIRGCV